MSARDVRWERRHADGMRLQAAGRDVEAEAAFREAIRHAGRWGIGGARLACTLYQLATLCRRRDRHAEAERLYRRAIQLEEHDLGPDHPYVAMILRAHARTLRWLGRDADATRAERRAEAIWAGAGRGSRLDEFRAPAA